VSSVLPLLAGFTLLLAGAEFLVRGGVALALRLGVTPLVVGLTVVAMGTSSPELVVSVRAAMQGRPGLAVGNVVGSNVCNIALILGACALVRPLRVRMSLVRREIPLLIAVTGLGWFVLRDDASRGEGALLVAGLVVYVAYTIIVARRESTGRSTELLEAVVGRSRARRSSWIAVASIVGGIVALAAGADLLVQGAVCLAAALGVSNRVIGLTVVAVGTSLPELATSMVATLRGESDLAVGNVVGSNLFNVLGVLGFAAVIHPIESAGVATLDQALSLGLAVALLPMAFTDLMVSRREGLLLIAVYASYVTWLYH
jgi:cation:H+ antiporter